MRRTYLIVFLAALLVSEALCDDSAVEALRHRLEAAGQPAMLLIGEDPVHASQALPGFYERRGFVPAWSVGRRFEPRARQLLAVISEQTAEGLRSEDYHLDALSSMLAAVPTTPEEVVDADLLLTDAFLILASHIVSGRVDPTTFDPEWIATRREVDVTAQLDRVVSGEDLGLVLRELRPHHAGYERLLDALARYRRIEAQGGWPRIEAGPSIKPGMSDPAVVSLRRRLELGGDLAGVQVDEPQQLDAELVQALIRFQQRHGLDDDGVLGAKTRDALNVSAAKRVRTLELNLERWRWLPQELGRRHLLVNVPAFRLYVSEEDESVLTMPVIVGRAMRRTPVFSDIMRYLVFSPSWEVPPTILRQDKLPEMRKDPDYAVRQNMQVFQLRDGSWVETDPYDVDWRRATTGTTRLRQRPGPTNALGLVKFMFPNSFNVYLHDTPSRELFVRSKRDFSSGCIRIAQPAELAMYVLRGDPTWTRESIKAAMESGRERSVTLPHPIPVHIQYWTAWVEDDGAVAFREDIYGRDLKLDAALRLPPPSEPQEAE